MSGEFAFIDALRTIATHPAARGLTDDAAVLAMEEGQIVLTMDTLVTGVHFLPDDPPDTIGWKLVAVNASDLSAKGAQPVGCLASYALGDAEWDRQFLKGLSKACAHFRLPLLGGDTVRMPQGAARSFSLTALGRVPTGQTVPGRNGVQPGDDLWVSGTIGDAGLWLSHVLGQRCLAHAPQLLQEAYQCPSPDGLLGPALRPYVHAMMDISDGLLVDADRMARASALALTIDLARVPLSEAYLSAAPDTQSERITAATAGDDYVLLFSAPPVHSDIVQSLALAQGVRVTRIGHAHAGSGLHLTDEGQSMPLPERLGYQH